VKATGLEGQSAEVVLRRGNTSGSDSAPDILAKQAIVLPPDGQVLALQLVDRPKEPGDASYTVEIAARREEINPDNNQRSCLVRVHDAKIRVLLMSGYPSYEFRFLKTLLERDSTVELSTYLQDADPEYTEQDKTAMRALPIGRDELFEYDVLVIGDVDPRVLPRSLWQNVRAFATEKGGGVAFIAGPRYRPWLYSDNPDVGAVLPIDLGELRISPDNQLPAAVTQGFVVQPTPLGLQSPNMQLGDNLAETEEIWRRLAPLFWLVQIESMKPAAQVLAVGPTVSNNSASTLPVVIRQFFGAGRVLFHATDSTWRWRIGVGDTFFARYWVQTIRYLARGKLSSGRGAELASDRREYRRGEPVGLRLRFRDQRLVPSGSDDATVLVEATGHARRRAILRRNPAAAGVFEGTLTDLGDGEYQVLLSEPQLPGEPPAARFRVVSPPGEMTRTEMDRQALVRVADSTYGKFYTPANADRLFDELPTGRRVPIDNLPPIPIWNRWWLLSMFLACMTAEWVLRKRKGVL
jgi:hypothetical protein